MYECVCSVLFVDELHLLVMEWLTWPGLRLRYQDFTQLSAALEVNSLASS